MKSRTERRGCSPVNTAMLTLAATLLTLQPIVALSDRKSFETTIDGVRRTAVIHLPRSASSKPVPLVLVFHGHGGTSRFSERKYPFHESWPTAVSIHPQGLPTKTPNDPDGLRNGWQINIGDYGNRDIKFFDALLAEAKRSANIDPNRIYVMGHSNGGRFAYVIWQSRPKTFAAMAPLAATGTGLIQGLEPISTFVLAGENDPIVKYRGQKLSLELLRANYSFKNKSAERTEGFGKYRIADNGAVFANYIHPGGHEVPNAAYNQIVQFFKSVERPKSLSQE